jgi:uncharacterized protein YuzE
MKITYDKTQNAAYIIFDESSDTKSANTYTCDPAEIGGLISLDFDSNGRLIGIEVLEADKRLPKILLKQSKVIG